MKAKTGRDSAVLNPLIEVAVVPMTCLNERDCSSRVGDLALDDEGRKKGEALFILGVLNAIAVNRRS